MHVNNSSLGDNWLQRFSEFRLNPDTFFDKRKLTHEAFCLDILKDISFNRIDIQCTIHLLLLLQEHSPYLIKDFNLLEQVCGSLTNLFSVLKNIYENRLLRSRILICISTTLLSTNLESGVEELISSLKKVLLAIIYNKTEDFVVISTACKCLEEIETCFPNDLESELKSIFLACENHLSPAFQNYASLLSLCLKNYAFEKPGLRYLENGTIKKDFNKDGIQLSAVVSYLMELISFMSPMSVYKVLKNIISVVKQSDDISPLIFKFFLPNLIFSSEVLYLDLAFNLLKNFYTDLFSLQEEKCLFRQLLLLSSHPCLTSSQRMLFLDWLRSCSFYTVLSCPFEVLKLLLPGPFDGPLTQEKKCCVIAKYIPKTVDKNLGLDFLNESISGLKKCVLLPCKTKAAASLFRTIFVFFTHHKQEFIYDYINKLLLNIMKTFPHLSPYALNFLTVLKIEFPESTFSKEVLAHMVNHILSLRMKQFTRNLVCNLAILEQASEICGSEYKPRSVLRLLQNLLSDFASHEINMWEFGNNILSVCRSIMLFHSAQLFYYDLAETLCLISQNIDDADVEYRAKIYYNELTTLSKLKMQSIFRMPVPEKDLQNSLTHFVPGVASKLQFASRTQVLIKPVVELVRIKKTLCLPSEEIDFENPLSDTDILKGFYKSHLDTFDAVVQLPFLLKHISHSEKTFDTLYGVVIKTQSSPLCKEISVIEIPVYKSSITACEECVFHIDIVPCGSQPMELHFEVEFTCSNGQSYICHPDPVFLNFKDFFLILPVPQSLNQHDSSWKKILFEILWEEFEKEVPAKSSQRRYCKSTTCLKIGKEELVVLIEEHLKEFIIVKLDDFKHWIAIFLPPKNHLLMKIDIINEKPFVNFVVDDVSVLPWIALYLQKLSAK